MKQFIPILFIAISSIFTKTNAQVNLDDSLTLVDLYNSTDGPNWFNHKGWLTGPVNSWYGITVESDRVVTINFYYNNLNGSIPESIGNLTALQTLLLSNNLLNGSIPGSIGNLTALQYLSLDYNLLSNIIPESIGNLTALQGLYLYYNQLSGSIPESIGNLTALKSLDLEGNQLSGIIPESIGNLTALQYLYLSFNQLNGTIPESTSNLTALKSLDLGSNRLSGSIPETIGNITVLQTLDLSFNQLSGSIPESIGNLSALQYLYLHSNQLSGSIPESVGNLTVLQSLYLNNNQLSSTVPESIGNLTALQILDLSLNQLSGTIPQSIGNLTALQYLSLSNNQLSGAIPSLLNLSISCYTNLSYNNFTFEGMEAVVKHFKKNYLTYVPQAIISLHEQGNLLSVSAGGSLSYNTYRWYRDGALVATNTGDSIYTVTIDGAYKVKVFNSICYALTLYSDSITTSVLPLTLLNFTAALQNNNALLNWSSTNELNTKEFIIQRSIDGVQFTNIGKLNARGNSSSVANYHYTDANITTLHSNKIYYRLQQQDINGSSSYSKTVVLNLSSQNSFVVYPNPAKNILHVQSNGKAVFVLHNNEGKILLKKTIDGNGEINIAALAAGLYYLKNTTTGEEKKIIKSL